jgi:hypothetical protein
MNRSALIAAAAGAFGATLLVAALQGSVLGVAFGLLFSPLPLAMAVLGLGPAALPVAVMSGAVTVTVLTGSFAVPVVYFLNDVLPVALLTRLVRPVPGVNIAQSILLGRAVTFLAILAAVLVGVVLIMLPIGPDGIEAALRSRIDEVLAEFAKRSTAEPARVEAAMKTLESAALFLPSGAGWNWCLRAIASAAVAQAILTRLGKSLEATPAYRQMAVPGWFFAVFWAAILVGWLAPGDTGYVAKNAAGVLCLPVVFQGLCVVHSALGRKANAGFWLVGFYLLALSLATVSFAVLVGIGVADQFLKLRERMAAAGQGGV